MIKATDDRDEWQREEIMADGEIEFLLNLATAEEAEAFAADIEQKGGKAEIREEKGILPLAILLWVVVPPGVALLATVANRIAHTWVDCGALIDARGTGRPTIRKERGLPYGTVVIITRDGETSEAQRSSRGQFSKVYRCGGERSDGRSWRRGGKKIG